MGYFKYVAYFFIGLSIVTGIMNMMTHSYILVGLSIASIIMWTFFLTSEIKKEKMAMKLVRE